MKRESLQEEQLKQARKDGVTSFDETVWVVSPKKSEEAKVPKTPLVSYVEAERFIDARSFGCRLFGVSEVVISAHVVSGKKPVPRWQVRFAGHATGSNTLRMQSRQITRSDVDPKWVDTREM